MSLENRSSSAIFKRAEQLKRWEQSDTNREPPHPKHLSRKIKFSADCIFLAACAAGDKDEVIRLLEKGADINTGNVDGLTALHQACIDDDLDMVEFLVEQGADINCGDNEGWTPLHATASCGFISIAKFLIEQGCNIAAVNNDGELALDIAESDEMEELLQNHINKAGIDCDQARSEEERLMLNDATLLNSEVAGKDATHPRSGATALHVAAAKGYIKVMNILLQARCDVNAKDNDGWTPLHGAAHWGQLEACKLLVENFCDMDIKNYAGQTAFDVADPDILKSLEDLKKSQGFILKDHSQIISKQTTIPKKRVSNNENSITDQQKVTIFEEETPHKVKKVELKTCIDDEESRRNSEVEKKNRVNEKEVIGQVHQVFTESNKILNQPPINAPKPQIESSNDENITSWRNTETLENTVIQKEKPKIATLKKSEGSSNSPNSSSDSRIENDRPELFLQRPHSFESDDKKNDVKISQELAKPPQCNNQQRSDIHSSFRTTILQLPVSTITTSSLPNTVISPVPTCQIRRSFVPPVRDEESETQRKAHAKRVRETRRSTQGVTLDEIKSAEQLVKKKQQQVNDTAVPVITTISSSPVSSMGITTPSITATITTSTSNMANLSQSTEELSLPERRPSWRLKVDSGSKFQLEDANSKSLDTATAYIRRSASINTTHRPNSAPLENTIATAETTVTLPLRRLLKSEDNDQDKENDSRNAQATQAVIQRRRRPKRRSTGVVHVDMDEIEPDKQQVCSFDVAEESKTSQNELEREDSGRSNRPASNLFLNSENSSVFAKENTSATENGEIDYKKLYEKSQKENDRLREQLKKSDEQLKEIQTHLERTQISQSKAVSETEKRERRAMERKLSEMEEELKVLETLKCENQRLKDENGALIRVISKLSK